MLKNGENNVKIKFNKENLKLIKERGIYLLGYGFSLTRIAIEGQKLISIEPQNLIKSKTEVQIFLTFSEIVTDLVGNIKLIKKCR